jgi:hypothetical protein
MRMRSTGMRRRRGRKERKKKEEGEFDYTLPNFS